MSVDASCHCGAVQMHIAAAPEMVTDCNCSICRRYGVLWAYYAPSQVQFEPAEPPTETYQRGERSIAFHRCRTCGCVTHWSAVDRSADRMAINARLLDPGVLAAARVRHLDGAVSWSYTD
ncbi:MAG: GFA family protein [Devosia sp.]